MNRAEYGAVAFVTFDKVLNCQSPQTHFIRLRHKLSIISAFYAKHITPSIFSPLTNPSHTPPPFFLRQETTPGMLNKECPAPHQLSEDDRKRKLASGLDMATCNEIADELLLFEHPQIHPIPPARYFLYPRFSHSFTFQ